MCMVFPFCLELCLYTMMNKIVVAASVLDIFQIPKLLS